MDNQLRAAMVDAAHVANWQRSGDKKIPQPKRIQRPGISPDREEKRIGGDVVRTPAEIDDLFESMATPEEVTDGS